MTFDTGWPLGNAIWEASVQNVQAELDTYMRETSHENFQAYQVRGEPKAAARVKELFEAKALSGAKPANFAEIDHSQVAK